MTDKDPRIDLMAHMRRAFAFALNEVNPKGKAKDGPTGELTIVNQLRDNTPAFGSKELFK